MFIDFIAFSLFAICIGFVTVKAFERSDEFFFAETEQGRAALNGARQ